MKTEQELKDELEDIFFDALTDKSNYTDKVDPENDGRWQYKVYELCADELIKRGYGDVSEYKAEIERLKDDYVKLQEQFADYQIASDKEIAAQAKQAKIDVLNELKERTYRDSVYYPEVKYEHKYVHMDDIDEMIEELEK